MLIENGDGTYTGGLLDVILIYHNINEGTFHPVFYEESPLPGPLQDIGDVSMVRLKSNMHHTEGFATLEAAQENVRTDLRIKILLPDDNIAIEQAIPWDGMAGGVQIVQNWRQQGNERTFSEVNLVPTR